MKPGEGLGREDLTRAAGVVEAERDIGGGVGVGERADGEAVVEAGIEGAIAAPGEAVLGVAGVLDAALDHRAAGALVDRITPWTGRRS